MSFLGQLQYSFCTFPYIFRTQFFFPVSSLSLSLDIVKQLLTDTTVQKKKYHAKQSSIHPSTDNTKSFSSSYHSNWMNGVSYSTSANFRYFCHWCKTKQIQQQAVSTDSFLIPLPSKLDGYDLHHHDPSAVTPALSAKGDRVQTC